MASGPEVFRFSIRQWFYAPRPYILEGVKQEPKYDDFSKVITDSH